MAKLLLIISSMILIGCGNDFASSVREYKNACKRLGECMGKVAIFEVSKDSIGCSINNRHVFWEDSYSKDAISNETTNTLKTAIACEIAKE